MFGYVQGGKLLTDFRSRQKSGGQLVLLHRYSEGGDQGTIRWSEVEALARCQ
jgi:hypothetical protein